MDDITQSRLELLKAAIAGQQRNSALISTAEKAMSTVSVEISRTSSLLRNFASAIKTRKLARTAPGLKVDVWVPPPIRRQSQDHQSTADFYATCCTRRMDLPKVKVGYFCKGQEDGEH